VRGCRVCYTCITEISSYNEHIDDERLLELSHGGPMSRKLGNSIWTFCATVRLMQPIIILSLNLSF
jgi:hypothetical protein